MGEQFPTHKGLAEEIRTIASWLNGVHGRKANELADKVDPDVDTPEPEAEKAAEPEQA